MTPIVSIIIPTYKHRDYILDALNGAFAQTFKNYEVIVVNDGSTDDTAEVLRPLIETGKIRYIEQPNAGQAAARNRGLAEAKGKFVALLDDDDRWPSDKLEWQVECLSAHPESVLVYGLGQDLGSPENIFPIGTAPSGDVRLKFAEENHIRSPGVTLIRTEALRAVGGFDETIWGVDDWDLYLRLSCIGDFSYLPSLALYYRTHEGNASHDILRLYKNAVLLCKKHARLFSSLGISGSMPSRMKRYFVNGCITEAIHARESGDLAQARRLWVAAMRLDVLACFKAYFLKELLLVFAPFWSRPSLLFVGTWLRKQRADGV